MAHLTANDLEAARELAIVILVNALCFFALNGLAVRLNH